MSIDGSGTSDMFNGDFNIVENGETYSGVDINNVAYVNGSIKVPVVFSADIDDIMEQKDNTCINSTQRSSIYIYLRS